MSLLIIALILAVIIEIKFSPRIKIVFNQVILFYNLKNNLDDNIYRERKILFTINK